MSKLAPIALFVYNRPDHTRRTINFLKANYLAEESRLYIFADGAKSEKDEESVKDVANLVSQVDGFKSVKVIHQKQNLGLANSIINGVTLLCNEYGKVIVFEDDLLSSIYTLQYFNNALNFYQDTEQVMHISASMFPLAVEDDMPETFLYRAAHSWGWATWKRTWDKFNPDIDSLIAQFDQKKIKDFSFDGKMNFWKQMKEFKAGKNDSWAIRWYASVFLNNGLTLNPTRSLINNIGHDGSGVHSNLEDIYDVVIYPNPVKSFPTEIKENKRMYEVVKSFYARRKGSLYARLKRFIRQKLR